LRITLNCAEQAKASSVVTHTHPEAIAGAIATAIAAAMAWRLRDNQVESRDQLLDAVIEITPESEVRRRLKLSLGIPSDTPALEVSKTLGKGDLVTSQDTVPFCIWMAANHLRDFVSALGQTISVSGDCDTNAAIVGGIVALSAGRDAIPTPWVTAREKFVL
jgi:ADP-ribosylglycohydrolase